MRVVIWLVAAFAAFYGGYWVVGSRALLDGTEAALAEMRAAGLADFGAVDLSGFPSRFDLTVSTPELMSADGRLHWSAPEINLHALSYKPHHIVALLPATQDIRIDREAFKLDSKDLKASAVFGIATDLPLIRAQTVGTEMSLTSDHGWGAAATEARLAVRRGTAETEQELGVELFGLSLSGLPARLIEATGALPAKGEHVRLDAKLRLDRPLDRFAQVEGIAVTGAEIRSAELEWGPLRVTGQGAVERLAGGTPDGRIDLSIKNWRAALPLLTRLGLIREELAPTVESAFEQLALAGGDAETLSLPLTFSNGRVSLGPIPLGAAPRF
ncbi:DUF2125 domain-containing protein [Defluviimonas sp. D31]|uniref:DUF2125 domain-containing protein n=1 Tax=Defluviimonas sp. D31 TaxID=3083253 RepID=UPI00296F51C9|nr:DUF2125 domain-containing protein [Defluviimonas sp. D31]MDW4549433.1 DUF2125 domain-containing protein [Defluviimonas sp. D31]